VGYGRQIIVMRMLLNSVRLAGPRIYLRTLGLEDATEKYCRWLNDPEVNRFLDTKSATMQEVGDYIVSKNSKTDALFLGT